MPEESLMNQQSQRSETTDNPRCDVCEGNALVLPFDDGKKHDGCADIGDCLSAPKSHAGSSHLRPPRAQGAARRVSGCLTVQAIVHVILDFIAGVSVCLGIVTGPTLGDETSHRFRSNREPKEDQDPHASCRHVIVLTKLGPRLASNVMTKTEIE
jgi:hypothetical protein